MNRRFIKDKGWRMEGNPRSRVRPALPLTSLQTPVSDVNYPNAQNSGWAPSPNLSEHWSLHSISSRIRYLACTATPTYMYQLVKGCKCKENTWWARHLTCHQPAHLKSVGDDNPDLRIFFVGGRKQAARKEDCASSECVVTRKEKKRILAFVMFKPTISARRKGSRTRANILHFRDRISMWPYGIRVERHKTFTYPQAPPITNRLFSTTGSKHRQHNYMLQYYYDSYTERDCFSPQLDILPSSLCFKLEIWNFTTIKAFERSDRTGWHVSQLIYRLRYAIPFICLSPMFLLWTLKLPYYVPGQNKQKRNLGLSLAQLNIIQGGGEGDPADTRPKKSKGFPPHLFVIKAKQIINQYQDLKPDRFVQARPAAENVFSQTGQQKKKKSIARTKPLPPSPFPLFPNPPSSFHPSLTLSRGDE